MFLWPGRPQFQQVNTTTMVNVTSLLMLWMGPNGLTCWLPLSLTCRLPVGVGWDAGSTSRTTSLGMVHVTSLLMLWVGLKGLRFWLPLSLTRGLPVGVGWDGGATRRSCVTASFLFQCLCRFLSVAFYRLWCSVTSVFINTQGQGQAPATGWSVIPLTEMYAIRE